MEKSSNNPLIVTALILTTLTGLVTASPMQTFNIQVTASQKALDKLQEVIIDRRLAKLNELKNRVKTDKGLARKIVDRHNRLRLSRRLGRVRKALQSAKFKLQKLDFNSDGPLISTRAIYSPLSKQTYVASVMSRRLKMYDSRLEPIAVRSFEKSSVKLAAFSSDVRKLILYTLDDSNTLRSFNITIANKTDVQEIASLKLETVVSEMHGFDAKVALRHNDSLQ